MYLDLKSTWNRFFGDDIDVTTTTARVHSTWIASLIVAEDMHEINGEGRMAYRMREDRLPTGHTVIHRLAQRLGVPRSWVYQRLRSGFISHADTTRDPETDHYLIRDDPELLARLRACIGKRIRLKP